jgi:hypothetical protein
MNKAPNQLGFKVFVVGLHKTGTSSFKVALEAEGYRVAKHFGIDDPTIAQTGLAQALEQVPDFDVFQDDPWWMFYKELHERFPSAKFVLTTRDSEKWFKSALTHFKGDHHNQVRKAFYGKDKSDPDGNRDHWIACKERHEQAVRDYFAPFSESFLEMDITAGDNWKQLGPFLGLKPRQQKFPKQNSAIARIGHRAKLEHKQSTGLRRLYLKCKVKFYAILDRVS